MAKCSNNEEFDVGRCFGDEDSSFEAAVGVVNGMQKLWNEWKWSVSCFRGMVRCLGKRLALRLCFNLEATSRIGMFIPAFGLEDALVGGERW